MAGTTIDEGGAVYAVLRSTVEEETGRSVPDAVLSRWSGTEKREAIAGVLREIGEDPSRVAGGGAPFVDHLFERFSNRLADAYAEHPPTSFAGVPEALAALRAADVQVALQTGYRREVAEALLHAVGWRVGEQVDALVAAEDVPASRPMPYLVFATMVATRTADVAEVLVAGDTVNDLLAGTRAGAGLVVGVLTGAHDIDELGRARHSHLVGSLAEVPALLGVGGAATEAAPGRSLEFASGSDAGHERVRA